MTTAGILLVSDKKRYYNRFEMTFHSDNRRSSETTPVGVLQLVYLSYAGQDLTVSHTGRRRRRRALAQHYTIPSGTLQGRAPLTEGLFADRRRCHLILGLMCHGGRTTTRNSGPSSAVRHLHSRRGRRWSSTGSPFGCSHVAHRCVVGSVPNARRGTSRGDCLYLRHIGGRPSSGPAGVIFVGRWTRSICLSCFGFFHYKHPISGFQGIVRSKFTATFKIPI